MQDLRRLLVVSPFVGSGALTRLHEAASGDLGVIARFEELARLDPTALALGTRLEIFDDPAALLDAENDADEPDLDADVAGLDAELTGLHAKVYVGERSRRAIVYVGSANATEAAFESNVELIVELPGSRTQHGIESARQALQDAGLLRPFVPGQQVAPDAEAERAQRQLERMAHRLGSGVLRARVESAGADRWRPTLHCVENVDFERLTIEARPLSEPLSQRVNLSRDPCAVFSPVATPSVTAFFQLHLTASTSAGDRSLYVTLRLPLDGAPDGRPEAATAELLSDRERLLRFMLLLLTEEEGGDRFLADLDQLLGERSTGGAAPASGERALGLPLLEPLLRALHRDPDRLTEVERLIADVRSAGGGAALLPPELDLLLDAVRAAR